MFISNMYETWWHSGCASTPCLFLQTFSAFILTKGYDADIRLCGFRMFDAPNPTRAPWWSAPDAGWPSAGSGVAQLLLLRPAGPCAPSVSGAAKPVLGHVAGVRRCLLVRTWCWRAPGGPETCRDLSGVWNSSWSPVPVALTFVCFPNSGAD